MLLSLILLQLVSMLFAQAASTEERQNGLILAKPSTKPLRGEFIGDVKGELILGVFPDNNTMRAILPMGFEYNSIAKYNKDWESSSSDREYLFKCIEVTGSLIGDPGNRFLWVDQVEQYSDSKGRAALQKVVLFAYEGCVAPMSSRSGDLCDRDLSKEEPGNLCLDCAKEGKKATEGLGWEKPKKAPKTVYPTRSIGVFGAAQCQSQVGGVCVAT